MRKYDSYKDSGVEWIGEIPSHWEVRKLKTLFVLQRGHDLANEKFMQGTYPVYGSNGIIGFHKDYTVKGPSITVGRSGSVGEINFVQVDFWAHNTTLYVKEYFKNHIKYVV